MQDRQDLQTVRPFCLDATEVTVDAYTACVATGRCGADHPSQTTEDGSIFVDAPTCNYGVSGRGQHPMNCVDWGQASTYCNLRGKRLPTEEEWEWAARGGYEARSFPWGSEEPRFQLCWSGPIKIGGTCRVGDSPAGDAVGGIHDLAGNVWEWTSNSTGSDARVARGGGWSSLVASNLGASGRTERPSTNRNNDLGFRCAR